MRSSSRSVALPLSSHCTVALLRRRLAVLRPALSCDVVALLRRRLAVQSPCPCRRPAPLPSCYPPSGILPLLSPWYPPGLLSANQSSCLSAAINRLAIRPSCLSSRHQPHCLQPHCLLAISCIAFSRHQSSCLSAAISRLAIRPSCLSSPCYPPCYPAGYCPLSRPTAVALPGRCLAVKCCHCSPHIP